MHFDIVVPAGTTFNEVQLFGLKYLKQKGQGSQQLSANECKFCHIEEASTEMEQQFQQNGYYIIEMEGC